MTIAADNQIVTLEMMQRELVSRRETGFVDWLDHVTILEPPPGEGLIPFSKWEHLMDAIECFKISRLICILKSRQIGFSWLVAAYALWTGLYQNGAVILLFSQGEQEAAELLSKCVTIHRNLPPHLKGIITKQNVKTIEFANGSRILAFPSTKDAGRGQTATLAIQDEADFHENADANLEALKPTLDAGGQLIQCSTVNKREMVTLFKANYRGSPKNGYATKFYGWDVRPGRDQEWYDRVRDEAPNTAEMSPDLYMESAYPRTAQEALRPTRIEAAFDPDILDAMAADVQKPLETHGLINIYRPFKIGGRYSAGTDTSHGVGGDNGVTVVLDVVTGMIAADIMSPFISPEELAAASVKMLAMYDNPIWVIEDNDWGIGTIRTAQTLGYPRLYERKLGNVGWHTDPIRRSILWTDLLAATDARHLIVPNEAGLAQFYDCIRNRKKGGRIEAVEGGYDDYPMATGLAYAGRTEAFTGLEIVPYQVGPAAVADPSADPLARILKFGGPRR